MENPTVETFQAPPDGYSHQRGAVLWRIVSGRGMSPALYHAEWWDNSIMDWKESAYVYPDGILHANGTPATVVRRLLQRLDK